MSDMPDWIKSFPGAVTVTDRNLAIVYFNDKAAETWAAKGGRSLIGSPLAACHNERSKAIIERLLAEGGTNAYTIEKAGVHKLIYQAAFRDDQGEIAGLVELSLVTPEGMPHYVRG